VRAGDTQKFADVARAHSEYSSLTRSAIDLAAQGKTTISEAIATTSGLDDPLEQSREETRSMKALKLPDPSGPDELSDALLSGRGS
jgi:hypothetical protein